MHGALNRRRRDPPRLSDHIAEATEAASALIQALRVAAIVGAGCAPVAALAAFASAPWLAGYAVTAAVFATIGAVARTLSPASS